MPWNGNACRSAKRSTPPGKNGRTCATTTASTPKNNPSTIRWKVFWNSNAAKPRTSFIDGGHLFEGWNGSETCRLTMLIGKQAPDIACIQVYSPKGLYRPVRHFGWVKLGSDDRNEGVDFGRRWAVSFVPFSLAALDDAPTDMWYENAQLGGKSIPVGTLYYDRSVDKVRCFTENGWKYLAFE